VSFADITLTRWCMHSFTQNPSRRWWQTFCTAAQKTITELVTIRYFYSSNWQLFVVRCC